MKESSLGLITLDRLRHGFSAVLISMALTGQCSLPSNPEPPCPTPHVVTAGESWWSIARDHEWTVEKLQAFNGIYDGRSTLQANATIQVPGPCPQNQIK